MSERKPGLAQLRLLEVMDRSGGRWPAAWRLNYAQQETMQEMEKTKRVERRDGFWHITDKGRKALSDRPAPKPVK